MNNKENIMVVTTNEVAGKEIDQTIGLVFGITVRSKNFFKQFGAGLKSLVGGEIKQFVEMVEESRDQALDQLRQNAAEIGADAVVAIRFDSDELGNDMETVTVYGTAVTFK